MIFSKPPPNITHIQEELDTQNLSDNSRKPSNEENIVYLFDEFPINLTHSEFYGKASQSTKCSQSQIDSTLESHRIPQMHKKIVNLDGTNQHLTMMSLEILCHSRDDLLPNPEQDQVLCIFYCVRDNTMMGALEDNYEDECGIIMSHDSRLDQEFSSCGYICVMFKV